MTEAVVRRCYTEIADVYIQMFGAISHVDPDDLQFLERNLARCAGTILDAGCGPGHLTGYLTDLGHVARGIDVVPAFIESARMNWPTVEFSVGSMHPLDLPDGSLGGILAWYSLIHYDPDDLTGVLRGLRAALSDDGILVVGFFEGDDVVPFAHKVATAYRWPVDAMSAMLSAAGFVEVDRVRRPGTGLLRAHAALAARAR